MSDKNFPWTADRRSKAMRTMEKQCQAMIRRETCWASYGRQCRRSATVTVEGKRYCSLHSQRILSGVGIGYFSRV